MSVVIRINDIDRTESIDQNLKLNRALTSQVDSCVFDVVRDLTQVSPDWKPESLDTIKIIEDGELIFGGFVTEISSRMMGGDVEVISVSGKDNSIDMDRVVVVTTYENTTVNAILDDLRDNWLPAGYNTDNVDCDFEIAFITFNYEYPTKCIQQLAELTNYDWYVDGAKNIYFKAKTATNAPFELTDDNGKYFYDTLQIKSDVKNLRNRIYVRGGSYQGDPDSESLVADGEATVYKQGYRYSNITVEVDGTPQTLGVDNLHLPADYDVLYNFQEKALKWREDNKPANGDVIEVSGNPHKPVLVRQQDLPSITEFGVFEFKVNDDSIETKQAGRDRARAELLQWKDEINEGSFTTKETGLEVGQVIHIESVKRGIDMDFIITRIASSMRNPQEFQHTCTLATTKTFGMIEFLQRLLIQQDKAVKVDENAILDIFIGLSDSASFSDSVSATISGSAPYYYDNAAVNGNEGNWNFATWV